MNVEEKVKKIIAEQLAVSEEEVKPTASFVDDLGADSLDQVELVMALEEDEAVFVNVVGDLKPDELGEVMENFDINLGSHDDHGE